MTFYKFSDNDVFINTIEAYPENKYFIWNGTVYLDDNPNISGSNVDNIVGVPKGNVSLYEYNIDRASGYVYPFLIKAGKKASFKTINKKSYHINYNYDGAVITSSYMLSSSLSRDYYNAGTVGATRVMVTALRYNFDYYGYLSPHYQYSSSLGDKSKQVVNLISIPSIMYGSSIKKGSVSLKYYVTGSLVGELSAFRGNGELVQVGPEGSTGSGSVAGVVLYNEGFIALTGSWHLNTSSISLDDGAAESKWIYYGYGLKPSSGSIFQDESGGTGIRKRTTPASPTISENALSASFSLQYSGTTHVQTLTMLASAPYGELNNSNNPTFASSSVDNYNQIAGKFRFIERPKQIKNTVYSEFTDIKPDFKKVVYLSKVGIYDDEKNLIGIAKMASPVRKTDEHAYTFKLKLDI